MTKIPEPATALPWKEMKLGPNGSLIVSGENEFQTTVAICQDAYDGDLSYALFASNALPALVEALEAVCHDIGHRELDAAEPDTTGVSAMLQIGTIRRARAALQSIGESDE